MSEAIGYFTMLTIAFTDGSIDSVPHRLISQIGYNVANRELKIVSEGSPTIGLVANKESAEKIIAKHTAWVAAMNRDLSTQTFVPNFNKSLNEEIQLKLDQGMSKVLGNLDSIISELATKSKTVSDIADTFITITKGKS